MTSATYRLLRRLLISLGFASCAILPVHFASHPPSDLQFVDWIFAVRGLVMVVVGLTIAIKLRQANQHIYFSLFLISFAINSWFYVAHPPVLITTLSWALTGSSFVFSMIKYPGAHAKDLYTHYFTHHHSVFHKPILLFTDGKKFWLIFFPVLLIFQIFASNVSSGIISQILNTIIIICGFVYFRISYILATKSDRAILAWVLWGVIVTLSLTLIETLVLLLYPEIPYGFIQGYLLMTAATICLSLLMGVFFAGFLDTGLVLRGTIVYSALFLVVIFLFSVIEHFIEKELALMLQIENDLISAFLAGFLALAINPLHKKLEELLPKF
ncbi:MAG: hypothetical protein WCH46_09120 [bacterium]